MASLTLRTVVRGDPRSTALTGLPVDPVARTVTHLLLVSKSRQAYAALSTPRNDAYSVCRNPGPVNRGRFQCARQ